MRVLDAGSGSVEIANSGKRGRIRKRLQLAMNYECTPDIDGEPDPGQHDIRHHGDHDNAEASFGGSRPDTGTLARAGMM
jgi:hypothetical protein